MTTLQQQTNDSGSPVSFLKTSNNAFSPGNPFSSPGSASQSSKPTTPGSQAQLATASRNLPPQVPPTYSPAAVTSPATRVSPMQRLCNQAKAVMELARGYQKEDHYQAYSSNAGYSTGRGSVASIPDLIPFDISQSSPPRISKGAVSSTTMAATAVARIEMQGREADIGVELGLPVVQDQPDEFIGAQSFLGDWPGFEYIKNGEQGTGYYNLGRPKRCTTLTAAAAAKANRQASATSALFPAQQVNTLLHPLGQRSVSESHIVAPASPPTVSAVAATAILPSRVASCTTLLAASGFRTEGVFPFDDSPSSTQGRSHSSAGKSSSPATTPSPTVSATHVAIAPAVAGLTIAAVAALGGSLSHLQFPASASPAATVGSSQVRELGSAALSMNLSADSATATATVTSMEAAQWQPFPDPPVQTPGTAAIVSLGSGITAPAGLNNGHQNGNTVAVLRPAFSGTHPPAHALHPYIYYPPTPAQPASQTLTPAIPGPYPPPNPPPFPHTNVTHSSSNYHQYAAQQQYQAQEYSHSGQLQQQQQDTHQHFQPSRQSLSRSQSHSRSHSQSQQHFQQEPLQQQQQQQHARSSQPQQQLSTQQLQSFSQHNSWQQNSQQNSQHNPPHNAQHNTQHNTQHSNQHITPQNSQHHSQHSTQQNSQQSQQQLQLPAHLVAPPQTWAQRGGPPLIALQHISQLPPEVQHMLHERASEIKTLQSQMQQQRQHRFKLTSDLNLAQRHIFSLETQIAETAAAAASQQQLQQQQVQLQQQPTAGRAYLPTGSRSMSLDLESRSVSVGGMIGLSAAPTVPALQARVLNLEGQLTATLGKYAALSQQLETKGTEAEKSSEETSRQMEKTQEIQQGTELQAQSLMQQLRESRAMNATASAQIDSKDQVIELLLQQLSMMTEQVAEMGPVGQHMDGIDDGEGYYADDDVDGYYGVEAAVMENGPIKEENGDLKEENGEMAA